jgi:hypothetical protein
VPPPRKPRSLLPPRTGPSVSWHYYPYSSALYSPIVHDERTDQFPDPIIATLSLPMIDDDVNVRVRVVASDKIGWSGYERYARDRTDIERRDVMAAYLLTGV